MRSSDGYSQLAAVQQLIAAEKSDLFDVLAYIRFALPPITRQARADGARPSIQSSFTEKQQAFLDFVLDHYVAEGIQELDGSKLSQLVTLRYGPSAMACWISEPTPRSGNSSPASRSFCINRLIEGVDRGKLDELRRYG